MHIGASGRFGQVDQQLEGFVVRGGAKDERVNSNGDTTSDRLVASSRVGGASGAGPKEDVKVP